MIQQKFVRCKQLIVRAGPEHRNQSAENEEISQDESAEKLPCLMNLKDKILALSFSALGPRPHNLEVKKRTFDLKV